jgi:hypothetical protein
MSSCGKTRTPARRYPIEKQNEQNDPQNSRLPISFLPPKSRNARNGNRLRSEKYGYIRVFIVAVMGNARGELACCLWPRRAPTRTVKSAAIGAYLAATQHGKDASSSRFLVPLRHPIRRRVIRSPNWRIVWCLAAKNRAAGLRLKVRRSTYHHQPLHRL